jgi:hypothetical protein
MGDLNYHYVNFFGNFCFTGWNERASNDKKKVRSAAASSATIFFLRLLLEDLF